MEQTTDKDDNGISAGLLAAVAAMGLAISGPLWWPAVQKLVLGDPVIKACENHVLGGLRSPSTYRLISSESLKVDGQLWVTLVYDADNAFGAPIRGSELCKFRVSDGEPVIPYQRDPDGADAARSRELDEALDRLNRSIGRSSPERKPCCLD